GLVWAGHHVALVSQIGRDDTADWLLAEASLQGLNCALLHRNDIATPELMLLMTPDGERTIIRPARPRFVLNAAPDLSRWDAMYVNTSAEGVEAWAKAAVTCVANDVLVVAQLPKGDERRPCHVLITSASDLAAHRQCHQQPCHPHDPRSAIEVSTAVDVSSEAIWAYGQSVGGERLRYFIVTEGEKGAMAYSSHGVETVSAVPAEVVDTTGAGDAFAAGVIHALLAGYSIQLAMETGAKWAAFAVETSSSIPGKAFKQYIEQR
ncbi:PfkB family carbohydrate kinase, partial [Photobacterium japonica]|uniref:PfkB family carbohydrate kinase n=1 Tax=Photobacterium japonica TaxID=2910235 RepID=UPI003D0BBA30